MIKISIRIFCIYIFSSAICFAQSVDGVLEWGNETVLAFPVTGVVKTVGVKAGEKVKKGQLLAQLDKQPFIIKIKKYKAKVGEIQPLIFDAKLDMAHAEELYERTVLSEVELQKTEAHLKGLLARETVAQSDVDLAQWQYNKSRLVSPFNGIVTQLNLQEGMVISEENKSEIKLLVAKKNIMQVSVLLDYGMIKKLKMGLGVKVIVAGEEHKGTVQSISGAAAAVEKIIVKIQFSHGNRLYFYAGQKAKVIFF